jgi:acyl carrier protein
MPDQALFDRLAGIVVKTFPTARLSDVIAEATSFDIDGWDSLSFSILIMNVEEAFEIELPLDQVYALANVGALAELIGATAAKKNNGSAT